MRGRARRIAAGAAVVSLASSLANACAFHNYLPEQTIVEQLMMTEHVILARPDPDDPTQFRSVEALQGPFDPARIPEPLDDETHARLTAAPHDAVLFARDGSGYGPYERLAYLDPPMRAVVDDIMLRKDDWVMGDDLGRYQFFADRLDHSNAEVRSLALRELDMAPYALLQALDLNPDTDRLSAGLQDEDHAAFAPISVLLLGLAESDAARRAIADGLAHSHRTGTADLLGPYATALVELDGVRGIEHLRDTFLLDDTATPEQIELVVEAIAIHASAAGGAAREDVLGALTQVLEQSPPLAAPVARQFQYRYDFGMADALAAALETGQVRSARDLIPVSTYVMMARQDQTFATVGE